MFKRRALRVGTAPQAMSFEFCNPSTKHGTQCNLHDTDLSLEAFSTQQSEMICRAFCFV